MCLWVSLKKSGLFSPLTFTTEGKASNPVCCSCCHGTVGQECSGLTVFLGCQSRSPGTYHQVSYYSERRICTVTEYPESSANTLCCDSDFFPSKSPPGSYVLQHLTQSWLPAIWDKDTHSPYVGRAWRGIKGFSIPFKNTGLKHVLSHSSFERFSGYKY